MALDSRGFGIALGQQEIKARELDPFYDLVQMLCKRWTRNFSDSSHRTGVIITSKTDSANAWAWDDFVGKKNHAVIFQEGLINSIRELSAQALPFVHQALSGHCPESLLEQFWNSLPNDAPHRDAFAELLGHAALAFLSAGGNLLLKSNVMAATAAEKQKRTRSGTDIYGNRIESSLFTIATLELGGRQFSAVEASEAGEYHSAVPGDGILGRELLRQFVVRWRKEVRISSPGRKLP